MTWNPDLHYSIRISLNADGKYHVDSRTFPTRQQLQPLTFTYEGYQDLEKEGWARRYVGENLFDACTWLYATAIAENVAIREIDLGGLSPQSPEVNHIREQFTQLTL